MGVGVGVGVGVVDVDVDVGVDVVDELPNLNLEERCSDDGDIINKVMRRGGVYPPTIFLPLCVWNGP